MAKIGIALLNESTVLANDQVEGAISALQIQVRRDFYPVWGVDADLTFVPKGGARPAGLWWLAIVDNPTQADALGYHEVSAEGLPIGYVFAALDQQLGLQWTVTASHELLEMLGDPDINLSAFVQTGGNTGRFYAYEVCDPCELDTQGYQIDSIAVSDFVYPAWFEGFRESGSTQFDHRQFINAPFKLLPGGYSQILDIPSGLGWYQVQEPAPSGGNRSFHPSIGSRRQRRMTPRDQWVRSRQRSRS